MKIWLDTDIGSDIDDALALAFLLCRDDCELVGISTVTERENDRAKLASALCHAAKKTQIPIFPGAQNALLISQKQTDVPQRAALERWPHQSDFSSQNAVLALREAILQNPGELTIFGIGPMTNLGALLALEPEIGAQIKEIVLMIGAFKGHAWDGPVEWNALNDPHGAATVFRAQGVKIRAIPFDVTRQVQLEREAFEAQIQSSPLGPVILDFAGEWFKETQTATFHDPLAAACLFAPELCEWESGTASVELWSEKFAGFTHWEKRENGPHQIAVSVHKTRFFELYFQTLANGRF